MEYFWMNKELKIYVLFFIWKEMILNKYNNFNISKILKLVKKEKITYIRLKLIIVLKKKKK